jgi:hypothetical protein
MSDLFSRAKMGIKVGLLFSCLYSVYVIGLYLIRGPAVFMAYGTTIGVVIASYFAGGIIAGAIVGALLPLTRFRIGAMLVYSIAAFFVFLSITIAMKESIEKLRGVDFGICVVAAIFMGVFGSFAWRNLLRGI